jgi:hypothetical protein
MYINLKGRGARGKHDCPFILGEWEAGGGAIIGVLLLRIVDLIGQF